MPILWQQKMSVGHPLIDDEHKHLICLINSVEIALQVPNHGEMLVFLLQQLYSYTKNHFSIEEKIMLKAEYGGYFDHKLEHQQILEDIDTLYKKLKTEVSDQKERGISENENPTSFADGELVQLLRSWVIDHVLKTDQLLKPVFENRKNPG